MPDSSSRLYHKTDEWIDTVGVVGVKISIITHEFIKINFIFTFYYKYIIYNIYCMYDNMMLLKLWKQVKLIVG